MGYPLQPLTQNKTHQNDESNSTISSMYDDQRNQQESQFTMNNVKSPLRKFSFSAIQSLIKQHLRLSAKSTGKQISNE